MLENHRLFVCMGILVAVAGQMILQGRQTQKGHLATDAPESRVDNLHHVFLGGCEDCRFDELRERRSIVPRIIEDVLGSCLPVLLALQVLLRGRLPRQIHAAHAAAEDVAGGASADHAVLEEGTQNLTGHFENYLQI